MGIIVSIKPDMKRFTGYSILLIVLAAIDGIFALAQIAYKVFLAFYKGGIKQYSTWISLFYSSFIPIAFFFCF
jgi:hypothetical protein